MTQGTPDWELLQEYARRGSEQAFSLLAARYVNLVYSAALRQVHRPDLAEEVTQIVFIVLAKKAKSISAATVLGAWLQKTTRFAALNLLKTEARRRTHERKAAEMTPESPRVDSSWRSLSPVLDEGIARLSESDRAAIMLRFFEHKSFAEVAASMGISEDAAGMRISRAVGRLRSYFQREGVALSSTALAGVMSANSVHAAPISVTSTIAHSALGAVGGTAANAASALAAANSVVRMMIYAKAKLVAMVLALTLAAGMTLGIVANYVVAPMWQRAVRSPRDEHASLMIHSNSANCRFAQMVQSALIRQNGNWGVSQL